MYVMREKAVIHSAGVGKFFHREEEIYERKVRYGFYNGEPSVDSNMEKLGHIEVSFIGNAHDCNHFGDGLEPFLKQAIVLYDRNVMRNTKAHTHNDYIPYGGVDCLPLVPDDSDFLSK